MQDRIFNFAILQISPVTDTEPGINLRFPHLFMTFGVVFRLVIPGCNLLY